MAERVTVNHDVAGSSPAGGAMIIAEEANKQKVLILQGLSAFYTPDLLLLKNAKKINQKRANAGLEPENVKK